MTTHINTNDAPAMGEILPVDVIGASVFPASGLMQLINGHYIAQAIYSCAQLRVPDVLADRPLTAEQVAAEVDAAPAAMGRLLRVAEGIGLLHRDGDQYALSDSGQFLRSDLDASLRPLAMLQGAPWRWATIGRLIEAVQTGTPQFGQVHGRDYYAYLECQPEAAEVFFAAMDSLAVAGQAIAAAMHNFSQYTDVYDIGGGDGTVLTSIMGMHQTIKGHLADRPHALERARDVITKANLTERITLHETNFFEAVPAGGDCYVLSLILNDCDDAAAAKLLANCRAVMSDDATLVVLDFVIRDDGQLHHADYLDLEGMLFSGGQARTAKQFETLFTRNGLQITGIEHNPSPVSCITARPQ